MNEALQAPNNYTILKSDPDKRLVFGWASVSIKLDGEQLEDRQQDMIDPEDLEESVYEYVLNFRDTGEEHIPSMRKKGKLVESCVFTKEKQQAMGIPEGTVPVGWWIGFKIEDDDAWERVKNGTYKMFSIEGRANRVPVEKADNTEKAALFIGLNVSGVDELERDGGESKDDFHVTLLYGYFDPRSHDSSAVDSIINRAVNAVKADIPETITFDGIRTFDPSESSDGKRVIYARVKSGQLEKVHEKLLAELKKGGMSVEKTFQEYHPHMTLAYVDPEEAVEDADLDAAGKIRKITIGLTGPDKEMNGNRTVGKSFNEILEKFNPYHDESGRFASATGYASFTFRTKDPKHQKWADMAVAREKERAGAAAANPTNDPETIAGVNRGKPMTHEQADEGRANPKHALPDAANQKMQDANKKLVDVINRGGSDEEKAQARKELDQSIEEYNKAMADSKQYRNNCQSCVVAYEARLRGYDVEAVGRTGKNKIQENLASKAETAWKDPATGKTPSVLNNDPSIRTSKQAQKWLEQNVEEGGRYEFYHGWKGTNGYTGHIVTVSKKGGSISIFDPQNGKTYTGDDFTGYMNRVKPTYSTKQYDYRLRSGMKSVPHGRLGLLRVDNLQLNEEVANAVLRGANG